MFELVTPAKAGVRGIHRGRYWIPAFAGMTAPRYFTVPDQQTEIGGYIT